MAGDDSQHGWPVRMAGLVEGGVTRWVDEVRRVWGKTSEIQFFSS